jgi:hypothetical protein
MAASKFWLALDVLVVDLRDREGERQPAHDQAEERAAHRGYDRHLESPVRKATGVGGLSDESEEQRQRQEGPP